MVFLYIFGVIEQKSENHVFLDRLFGVITKVETSSDNYVEWCFQNAKGMSVGLYYEHIMIL